MNVKDKIGMGDLIGYSALILSMIFLCSYYLYIFLFVLLLFGLWNWRRYKDVVQLKPTVSPETCVAALFEAIPVWQRQVLGVLFVVWGQVLVLMFIFVMPTPIESVTLEDFRSILMVPADTGALAYFYTLFVRQSGRMAK